MGLYQRAIQLSFNEKPKGLYQKSLNYILVKESPAPASANPVQTGIKDDFFAEQNKATKIILSENSFTKRDNLDTEAVTAVLETVANQNIQTVLIEISLTAINEAVLKSSKKIDKTKLAQEVIRIFNSFLTDKDRLFLDLPQRILLIICRRRLPSNELFFHQWRTVFNELLSFDIEFNEITRTFFCPKDSPGVQQAIEWIKTFQ